MHFSSNVKYILCIYFSEYCMSLALSVQLLVLNINIIFSFPPPLVLPLRSYDTACNTNTTSRLLWLRWINSGAHHGAVGAHICLDKC